MRPEGYSSYPVSHFYIGCDKHTHTHKTKQKNKVENREPSMNSGVERCFSMDGVKGHVSNGS